MSKIYSKNTWQDEALADDERYDIAEDDGTPISSNVQIALATAVVQAGTAVDAARMNNIEDGIDGLDTLLTGAIINVKNPNYGAVGDGVTDDTAAIQAAIDAAELVRGRVFIPFGVFPISTGLVINTDSVSLVGAGRGSILAPTDFAGPVLKVTNSNWDRETGELADFAIVRTAIYAGQDGIELSGSGGIRARNVTCLYLDTAWNVSSAQFCSFDNISGSRSTVGLKVVSSPVIGGGNNNTFKDCWFSYNSVGVFMYSDDSYPFHNNKFINLVTHANTTCAFYAEQLDASSIENWAPEANGGSGNTTVDGITVKESALHAVGSCITLRNYAHVSNTLYILAESSSFITIDGGGGASTKGISDDTSFINFSDNAFGMYYGGSYFLDSPLMYANGNTITMFTEPFLSENRAIRNEAPGDVVRCQEASGTTSTAVYATSDLGDVLTCTFSDGTKQLVLYTALSDYTTLGTKIVASFLVRSDDSSAGWSFDFAQSTVYLPAALEAGKWYRVVLYGTLTATPRGRYIIIKATNAAAYSATLNVARLHAFTVDDIRTLAGFVRHGWFNPNTQPMLPTSADNGDADLTLVLVQDAKTQRFNTALTAGRTVTLPTVGTAVIGCGAGAKYRVVRQASATGASGLDVGGLKTLAVSEWCDVEHDGTAWLLTAYGAL